MPKTTSALEWTHYPASDSYAINRWLATDEEQNEYVAYSLAEGQWTLEVYGPTGAVPLRHEDFATAADARSAA